MFALPTQLHGRHSRSIFERARGIVVKTPHRIFEIYNDRDEAIRVLTPRNAVSPDHGYLDSATFQHLSVSVLDCILHVEFVGTQSFGAETLGKLQEDFAELSSQLPLNSQVLVDFRDVEEFSHSSIELIVGFNKRVRNKGSRVVLCCIGEEAQGNFFPNRKAT